MASLLADKRLFNYNVLAIQELWINPFNNYIYYPSNLAFFPYYGPKLGRTLFLVNKRFINSFSFNEISPDFISLTFNSFTIFNLYLPPSSSYSSY